MITVNPINSNTASRIPMHCWTILTNNFYKHSFLKTNHTAFLWTWWKALSKSAIAKYRFNFFAKYFSCDYLKIKRAFFISWHKTKLYLNDFQLLPDQLLNNSPSYLWNLIRKFQSPIVSFSQRISFPFIAVYNSGKVWQE